jgi:hypothetical protein
MAEDVSDADSQIYDVKACAPSDLTEDELAACVAIIKKGGAVNLASVKKELPQSGAVVIARKGNLVVGVGAIKRVRRSYAASVSTRSGVIFPPDTQEL